MQIKRVLNIEDTAMKHVAVKRALERCGITKIDHATTATEGLDMIELAEAEGNPYQVIVSDMYFPMSPGGLETNAGDYVIDELKRREIHIPVIVCSSMRLNLQNVVGCIWYNELRGDLDADMREMIEIVRNM